MVIKKCIHILLYIADELISIGEYTVLSTNYFHSKEFYSYHSLHACMFHRCSINTISNLCLTEVVKTFCKQYQTETIFVPQ